jgi:hypothetical protein
MWWCKCHICTTQFTSLVVPTIYCHHRSMPHSNFRPDNYVGTSEQEKYYYTIRTKYYTLHVDFTLRIRLFFVNYVTVMSANRISKYSSDYLFYICRFLIAFEWTLVYIIYALTSRACTSWLRALWRVTIFF